MHNERTSRRLQTVATTTLQDIEARVDLAARRREQIAAHGDVPPERAAYLKGEADAFADVIRVLRTSAEFADEIVGGWGET